MSGVRPYSALEESCQSCRWSRYDSFHDEAYCTNENVDAYTVQSWWVCDLWDGEEDGGEA